MVIRTTLAALGLVLLASPVNANIFSTLRDVRIRVLHNPPISKKGYDGAYYHKMRSIVICQTNGVVGSNKIVEYTANDLDTLKHEMHHVVQDCLDGTIDGDLVLFDGTNQLVANYDQRKVLQVRKLYDDVPQHIRDIEVEAYAVASSVSIELIAKAVTKFCYSL